MPKATIYKKLLSNRFVNIDMERLTSYLIGREVKIDRRAALSEQLNRVLRCAAAPSPLPTTDMTMHMRTALQLALVMLVGAFIASTATAQETDTTAAPQDTTVSAQDAEMPADDAVGTAEDIGAVDTVTVEWVVSEAADDAPVTLRGRLVEALEDEQYLFEDETGTIQVEIDDENFNLEPFQAGLYVEISGEVDKDEVDVIEIDVARVTTI